jgi:hypothetical protein
MNSFGAGDLPMLACIVGFHIGRVFMDSMHTVDMGVAGWARSFSFSVYQASARNKSNWDLCTLHGPSIPAAF